MDLSLHFLYQPGRLNYMNKPLILVVEDDIPVRNLVTTTLKAHDYRFLTAANGESAVLEASSHNPEIILLDLGLPDVDGVEVIHKVRSWSNVPIIVISARSEDTDKIEAFAREHDVDMWLQPKGPDSAYPMHPEARDNLKLKLEAFDVAISFKPTDFTQVNHRVNREMVSRAVDLLGLEPEHNVADFFCGLGNFTLPLARTAKHVTGIEGSEALVERARAGAAANGLAGKTDFVARNLFTWSTEDWDALWEKMGGIDRVLIDPPREGAQALAKTLAATDKRPARVVYVSCNPATLARDCAILLHEGGWHVRAAGVMNMFPHTAHVESIAVLEPGEKPVKVVESVE